MRYALVLIAFLAHAAAPASKMLLRQDWAIQSSADVREDGTALSAPGFRPARAWHPATLPTTVFSALVAAGVYPDPYFGTTLRSARRQLPHRLQLMPLKRDAHQELGLILFAI